jgi:thiol-disulfide isomerase/thioredoxin
VVRRIVAALVALILLAVIARSCSGGSDGSADNGGGDPPASLLADALASFEGEVVVVNFWATWCEPCKVEMPHIVKAAAAYEGRVRFLGVNVEDDVEAAADFAKRYGMRFRSISDPAGDIRRAERLLGLPATQFYDASGELAFLKQGEIKADELDEKIEQTLRASR